MSDVTTQAMLAIGQAGIQWRALAEQMEQQRNAAYADLTAQTRRAEAAEARVLALEAALTFEGQRLERLAQLSMPLVMSRLDDLILPQCNACLQMGHHWSEIVHEPYCKVGHALAAASSAAQADDQGGV